MVYFWAKESLKLIKRAKSSFVLSLISTSISVILISASLLTIRASDQLQKNLKQSVNINVFLKDSLSANSILQIKSSIQKNNFIRTVDFISKEEAAKNFIKQTGEDFRKLLDYNPLPPSFTITLKGNFVNKDSLSKISESLSKISGVDEVVFQQEFIYKVLNYLSKIKKYVFAITFILLFISIYIVYSTVKLIINAKYEEMETMKLVGAKLSTIKVPIILNCIFTGFLSGVIVLIFFKLIQSYFHNYLPINEILGRYNAVYAAVVISIGPILGLLVSIVTLRKITLRI